MRELVQGHSVACQYKTRDRSSNIGADMVRTDMALAFVRYSHDYVEQEAAAKAAPLGIHAHYCIAAWEWRARQRGDQ